MNALSYVAEQRLIMPLIKLCGQERIKIKENLDVGDVVHMQTILKCILFFPQEKQNLE